MSWISQHKLIFIILIIAVAASIWYGLTQVDTAAPTLTTSTPTAEASAAGSKDLVSSLLALRAVTLSGTIFSDPALLSLHDNGTTIVSEPVGRDNPFAPLRSTEKATATTTHQAQIFAPKK